jgi:hypothetical protein
MKTRIAAPLFILALTVAVLSAAGTLRQGAPAGKPDLTGTWTLDLEKCRLQFPPKLDGGTITIEHREPAFRFSRTFVENGKEDTVAYELTTDGREKVVREPGRTTTSRMSWDGDTLVLDERIVLANGRAATNVVRYSLQDGGRTLVAEEKFRAPFHKHDNLWVAERKN